MDDVRRTLQEINTKLHQIDKTLAVNTNHLDEHMRRTKLLEDNMGPVARHVEQMKGAGKLLGLLALIATVAGIVALF